MPLSQLLRQCAQRHVAHLMSRLIIQIWVIHCTAPVLRKQPAKDMDQLPLVDNGILRFSLPLVGVMLTSEFSRPVIGRLSASAELHRRYSSMKGAWLHLCWCPKLSLVLQDTRSVFYEVPIFPDNFAGPREGPMTRRVCVILNQRAAWSSDLVIVLIVVVISLTIVTSVRVSQWLDDQVARSPNLISHRRRCTGFVHLPW